MADDATQTVFLFVGGPLDGERRAVELNEWGNPNAVQVVFVFDPAPSGAINYRSYDYRFTEITDADKRVIGLYVGEDVTDPFARLVAGYKRGEGG